MTHVFKHPKYYEDLRRRKKEEMEASSAKQDPGHKRQASSDKHQAAKLLDPKDQAPKDSSFKRQASSPEQQGSSDKPRAASSKISLPS